MSIANEKGRRIAPAAFLLDQSDDQNRKLARSSSE